MFAFFHCLFAIFLVSQMDATGKIEGEVRKNESESKKNNMHTTNKLQGRKNDIKNI